MEWGVYIQLYNADDQGPREDRSDKVAIREGSDRVRQSYSIAVMKDTSNELLNLLLEGPKSSVRT